MISQVDARTLNPDAFPSRAQLEPLLFDRDIRFYFVEFAYEQSSPVLRDVDLGIRARTSVAFVGSTGAGKTTLIDLLLGILVPTNGTSRSTTLRSRTTIWPGGRCRSGTCLRQPSWPTRASLGISHSGFPPKQSTWTRFDGRHRWRRSTDSWRTISSSDTTPS